MIAKLLMATTLLVTTAVPAVAQEPPLSWARCAEQGLERFECGTLPVPMDYARPGRAKLGLAVLRQKATGDRIGTVVVVVGGPGSSGIDAMRGGSMVPAAVNERFDVVVFDQRGIGRSRQVKCHASPAAQEKFWLGIPWPPVTAAEERQSEVDSKALARGCAEHSPDLLANLSTADVARDLDELRKALGEKQINFSGGSYASYVGAVYGAMFGDRLRAMNIFSVIDPDAYTNDTLTMVRQRAAGTAEVWREFARICAGHPNCAYGGPDVDGRALKLLERLKNAPVTVGTGAAAIEVRYRDLVPVQVALLYDPQAGWLTLGALLATIEAGPAGDPALVRQLLEGSFRADFLDSLTAISCADHRVPKAPGVWPALARSLDADHPHWGRQWLYPTQPCATWPVRARKHTGPWRLKTEALLINNRFDPVTPLAGALNAQRQFGKARMVIIEGHGHDIRNACTDRLRADYLISLKLPADGTTCTHDELPFTG